MPMPGRTFPGPGALNRYKYGFNGKENDNEVVGTASGTQDYGMRIYNPALGRFLSVDPISSQYPMLTPFQFSSNSPIMNIDLDGLEGIPAQKQANGTYKDAQNTSYLATTKIVDLKILEARGKQKASTDNAFKDMLEKAGQINGFVGNVSDASEAGMKGIAENYQLTRNSNFVKISKGETKLARNVEIATKDPSLVGKFSDGFALAYDFYKFKTGNAAEKKEAASDGVIDAIAFGLNFTKANPLVGIGIQIIYNGQKDPEVQNNILNTLRVKAENGSYKDYKDVLDYSKKINSRKEPLELKFEQAKRK